MNYKKMGKLIAELRKEKGMSQKDLADQMNISDRTISRWERAVGCPDVSLFNELSNILGVNIEKILLGDLSENQNNGGNMKNIKFYVCAECNNTLFSTNEAEISCCGRKLKALVAQENDTNYDLTIEEIENDYYITFNHEMKKSNYISFVAYLSYDRVNFIKLYPEQNPEVRFLRERKGDLYYYSTTNGLKRIKK